MLRIFIGLIVGFVVVFAGEVNNAKVMKLALKGKKVVEIMCDKKKLPLPMSDTKALGESIINKKACSKLSADKLESVVYYINSALREKQVSHIDVPTGAKCPVCGMFVSKYPKWAAYMDEGGKKHYFDGVKDMMKFYIFDADFPFDRLAIKHMKVTDFYTLQSIDAKEAYYVSGSNVYGPMGNELVSFASKEAADNFKMDHGGSSVLMFGEITPKIVMGLDGIEFDVNKSRVQN